jgi:hypothetical protein
MADENDKNSTEQHMQGMAEMICDELNSIGEGLGFALLVFPLLRGDVKVNYISNANRDDMVQAFKDAIEQLENLEP